MIRAITTVRRVPAEAFDEVGALLDALGFERGPGWDDAGSRGRAFLAPTGALEIVAGDEGLATDLVVEVTDLEGVYRAVTSRQVKIAKEPHETTWKSRIFTAELVSGLRVAFFEFTDPEKKRIPGREGSFDANGLRFAVVVSRWNAFITERMLEGALDALRRCGARREDVEVTRVPGSFEIPSAARLLAESGRFDAIVTVGCLIRGETSHYEHIATEVTRGIGQSAQETGVPHAYGVITVENLEQAIDRAGLKSGNKGFEAALTAIEMANLKRGLK